MTLYDPRTTALVSIDLQGMVIGRQTRPHSAETVIANTARLAENLRAAGGTLAFVRVKFAPRGADAPPANVDAPGQYPPDGTPPEAFAHAPALAAIAPDIDVVKRQWGAFHGTELDTLLRRRHIATIILCGIATNFGVESTAREAWSHGYDLIIAEDAITALDAAAHDFAVKTIFPRLSRVRSTAEILANE
jgi:nicotinamidase-related amidase